MTGVQINTAMWAFVITALLVAVLYTISKPVLKRNFAFGDDYRLVAMQEPDSVSTGFLKGSRNIRFTLTGCLKYDTEIGRFRPLAWVHEYVKVKVLGKQAAAYRLYNLFLFSVLIFVLSLLFLNNGLSVFISSLLLSVLTLGSNAESYFTLIPPAQNLAEVLLAFSFFFLLKQEPKKWAGLFCLFLAAITKESFAFIFPFVLWMVSVYKVKFTRGQFVFSFLPLTSVLITILLSGRLYGYSTLNMALQNSLFNATEFILSAFPFVIILGWMLLKGQLVYSHSLLVAFFLATLVQLGLLIKIKLDAQHHYLMPFLFLFVPLLVNAEWKRLNRVALTGVFVFLLGVTAVKARNTANTVNAYSANLGAFEKALSYYKANTCRNVYYVSAISPNTDWMMGTALYLYRLNPEVEVSYLKTHPFQHRASTFLVVDPVETLGNKGLIFFEQVALNGVMQGAVVARNKSHINVRINRNSWVFTGALKEHIVTYPVYSFRSLLTGGSFTSFTNTITYYTLYNGRNN